MYGSKDDETGTASQRGRENVWCEKRMQKTLLGGGR